MFPANSNKVFYTLSFEIWCDAEMRRRRRIDPGELRRM
jgi:hypothetical protein